jgi:hypothetical protein
MEEETVDTSAQDTTGTDVTTETNTEITNDSTETKVEETKQSAPEEYADFTAPEGMVFDKESAGDFMGIAKDLGLTQDGAQKLIDLYGTKLLGQQEAQRKQLEDWATESTKSFKPAEIELANKTLSKFGSPELIEVLKSTGLGNHKQMIALFKNIGSQISEGQFVDGGTKYTPKSAADVLYPSMNT